MKQIFLLALFATIFSCAKKEVKLPVLAEKGIQEVQNHSQVWIFFKVNNNDTIANVNSKNTISTTNWLYNIDKRLPLKYFIEEVKKLKVKHHNSVHSKEGMADFFSYSDSVSQKLSFIPF
ncbi:MAG TPA: hypothetical protein VJ970_00820, partial [Flavobacteriaceae bacterium]|nr:hypothetical protein [Flavobacteriaceae bacterium]